MGPRWHALYCCILSLIIIEFGCFYVICSDVKFIIPFESVFKQLFDLEFVSDIEVTICSPTSREVSRAERAGRMSPNASPIGNVKSLSSTSQESLA